jgi:hypothetical protein
MKKPTPNYFVLRLKFNNYNSPFFIAKILKTRFSFLRNPFQLPAYFHAKTTSSKAI